MRKKCRIFLIALCMLRLISADAHGISAACAAVTDANSGRVLYEFNGGTRVGMASTTKIMTALCAIENSDLNSTVTVSQNASDVEGSSVYLEKGEKMKLSDLLYGVMLASGNDAATAVAEHVSGSADKFVKLMNDTALDIGAYDTHFTNPHGLSSDEHRTTALDLAKITAHALENPVFAEIAATKTKNIPWEGRNYSRKLVNHNKFLSMYDGCIGVKTGFTKATGRCLVTAVEKDGMKLICVTLNAPDDWNDHHTLYDRAFNEFKPYTIKHSGDAMGFVEVSRGEVRQTELLCPEDITIPLKQGEENSLTVRSEPYEGVEAPVSAGDILGKITVSIDDKPCGEFPLCAKDSVALKRITFRAAESDFSVCLKKIFLSWIHCFG